MNFILAVKNLLNYTGIFYEQWGGGVKKVGKYKFLFFDPVARVLANGNRTIETVTKRYLSQK